MKRMKLTKARQERFLKALADTGSVTAAVAVAGTSRSRVYKLRRSDPAFAASWDEAEEIAADGLEAEARRRAIDGVLEPVVSGGRVVRDVMVNRSRSVATRIILLALLRAHRPPRREKPVRFQLPALQTSADAACAMAVITAGVAAGEVTTGEAAELSRLVEAYVKALEASEFDLRLRAIETKR
jgi:hypothetical protein